MDSRTPGAVKLTVVLPVFGNAGALPELYRRLCSTLESLALSFELVCVDDASRDDSLTVLEQIARNDSRVAVIALAHNVGQHRAVLVGFSFARGEWVVVMDADLQDEPETVPALWQKAQTGYAAVFAGRHGKYESPFRLVTSRVFKWALHILARVPSDAGLFVVLNRELVQSILELGGTRPFVVAMIGCVGLPVASIPVERVARPVGNSAYSFAGRVRSAWRGIRWTLAWRWDTWRGNPREPFEPAPIKTKIGARFE